MTKAHRSEDFKKMAVQKFLDRKDRTVAEICRELEIGTKTIYEWINKYSQFKVSGKKVRDNSIAEKFELLKRYYALSENERGEFLRREGFYSSDLAEMELEAREMELAMKKQNAEYIKENRELKEKLNSANREILRKDKALAEAAALLILKKKVRELLEEEALKQV
jgi:hypothetical protein